MSASFFDPIVRQARLAARAASESAAEVATVGALFGAAGVFFVIGITAALTLWLGLIGACFVMGAVLTAGGAILLEIQRRRRARRQLLAAAARQQHQDQELILLVASIYSWMKGAGSSLRS